MGELFENVRKRTEKKKPERVSHRTKKKAAQYRSCSELLTLKKQKSNQELFREVRGCVGVNRKKKPPRREICRLTPR